MTRASWCVAGVDVGSTLTKVVVHNGVVLAGAVDRTEPDHVKAAARLLGRALERAQRAPADLAYVVATGYGRRRIPFAHREVTEITCHARGARELFPGARTIIDIGGQDAKGIKLGPGGRVADFAMNDKCAAGTGRFLEVMAATLGLAVDDLGRRGLGTAPTVSVSSVCTVFSQQELARHLAGGVPLAEVLAALHEALASRVHVMVRRLRVEADVVLTGGCARNPSLVRALAGRLGMPVLTPPDPLLTGALGAALLAQEAVERGAAAEPPSVDPGVAGTVWSTGTPAEEPALAWLPTARFRLRPQHGRFALERTGAGPGAPAAGVDVGALFTKAAVVTADHVHFAVLPSEADYRGAATRALGDALLAAGVRRDALRGIAATGLGASEAPGTPLSEVACLGRGIARLFPEATHVLDIGANGTRAVRLGPGGRVRDFSVTGQCAAGSARILGVMAHLLGVEVEDLGALSLRSTAPADVSAGCAVFAETEAISLLTRGVSREDLLAGLHVSLAQKILALARAQGPAGAVAVAGGGARDAGLVARLAQALGTLLIPPEPMVAAALGGALLASERSV